VNIVTKSGTNSFHGSGYFYYRSDATSARNPFDTLNPGQESADRQFFPGFTLGGPIVKNKLFFFADFLRVSDHEANTNTITIPTMAFRAGDFTKPFAVHAQTVPGSAVMTARRSVISYDASELPRGGEVRMRTSDPAAIEAIHQFLAFQRTEHHAASR